MTRPPAPSGASRAFWTTRRRRATRALGAALVVAALPAPSDAASGAWSEQREARVRLVSRWAEAPAGGDPGLGLEFALAPGWHVYWKNAGDAGYAPKLDLEGGGELRYPAPHRFVLPGDLMSFGYEREVIYPIDGVAPSAGPGPRRFAARLDYLVCAESCVPYDARLQLELPVGGGSPDPELAPRVDAWRARLPRPASETAIRVASRLEAAGGADQDGRELVLTLAGEALAAPAPDLFFEVHPRLETGRPRFVATAEGPSFRVPLRRLDATRPWPERVDLAWTATGFELAGRAAAFDGRLDLPSSTYAAAAARPARLAGALALSVVLAVLLGGAAIARRRRRTPSRSPVHD
jgi:DsbC/DsbD-like thiol-disulfide interchange protein